MLEYLEKDEWNYEVPLFTKERLHLDQWARFLLTVSKRLNWLHSHQMDFEKEVPKNSYRHREYIQRINNNRIYYKCLCGGWENYMQLRTAWILH